MNQRIPEQSEYRNSHAAVGYGNRYDDNYSRGYYASLFRDVETPLMESIFSALGGQSKTLLDFACGTGRITSLAVRHFGSVTGVDVSDAMLQNARSRVAARFVRHDITRIPLGEEFDVITAFRFFLNAEPELRHDALMAIRKHMKPSGKLVCNVHMNHNSLLGLFYRSTRWLRRGPQHNTLSFREFKGLLSSTGFSIERVVWYGAVPRPGRLFEGIMDRFVGPIEAMLLRSGIQLPICHTFLVVATLGHANE